MEIKDSTGSKLAHSVFFTLADSSEGARQALMSAAQEFLDGHAGCLSFCVGERAEKYVRDVNDADFHVALNMVFESVAAHDAYQVAPRHLEFIESQKSNWAAVRVFDASA